MNEKVKESNKTILENSKFCYNSFPEVLKIEEETFGKRVALENESNRNKLIKLYKLSDKILAQTKEFTACKSGCSHCCHINVNISILEAEYIEKNTGIKKKKFHTSKTHKLDEFIGQPCPFLKDNKCSIYSYRPFACRKHISFDKDNYWCKMENCMTEHVTQIKFDYEKSYEDVTKYSKNIFGDIRDFFSQ